MNSWIKSKGRGARNGKRKRKHEKEKESNGRGKIMEREGGEEKGQNRDENQNRKH